MMVKGQVVPVIGRICMDQCMIDVTGIENLHVGDEVIIFGNSGSKRILVEDVANAMGTINYEVLCVIGKRIPRVYIHNGKIVEVLNYLV
jgi:alanine racemase